MTQQQPALTARQRELIDLYVETYPHLAELSEQAALSAAGLKTLGDAMAMQPYPAGVTGADALEIGRIGMTGAK